MLDAKIIVVGVAGIFLALGITGAVLVGFGHVTTAVGQSVGSGPISQAGDSLSGLGIEVIAILVLLAIVVVLAFLLLR